MNKQGKRKQRQCVYCGEVREISKEHVIPKALFTQPFPLNLITVPACDGCNTAKSLNDDFLRDFLVCDIHGNQHPIAQRLFEKVLSSQRQDSSVIARDVLSKGRVQPFYTIGGVYLGNFPTTPINGQRMNTIFSTIVRGLYYKRRRQRIPNDYSFQVLRHFPWNFEELWKGLRHLHFSRPHELGDVFGYTFVSAKEDTFTSLWLLWFYNRIIFSVSVMSPALQALKTTA